jgi:hypothetical protein
MLFFSGAAAPGLSKRAGSIGRQHDCRHYFQRAHLLSALVVKTWSPGSLLTTL